MNINVDCFRVTTTYIKESDLTIVVVDGDSKLDQPYILHVCGEFVDDFDLRAFVTAKIKVFNEVTRKSQRAIESFTFRQWNGSLKDGTFDNVTVMEFKENDYIRYRDQRVGTLTANMDSVFLVNKLGHLDDITTKSELVRLYMPKVDSIAHVNLYEMLP